MSKQKECKCEQPTIQPKTKRCGRCGLYIDRVRHIEQTNVSDYL